MDELSLLGLGSTMTSFLAPYSTCTVRGKLVGAISRICAVAIIVLSASTVPGQSEETADEVSEFGVAIGALLTVPVCAYAGSTEGVCVERIGSTDFSLRLAESARPAWIRQVFISTRDGLVEKFLIDTSPDPAEQQRIVERLTTKYGRPQQLRTLQKYNRFGAIMSLEAEWHVHGVYIFYTGAESLLAGTLAIKSEREQEREENEKAARAGK